MTVELIVTSEDEITLFVDLLIDESVIYNGLIKIHSTDGWTTI